MRWYSDELLGYPGGKLQKTIASPLAKGRRENKELSMNYIWNITIDDYLETIALAKKNGKKPGDRMDEEFLEIMKKKGKKKNPIAKTEKDSDMLTGELRESGLKVFNLEEWKRQRKLRGK